LEHVVIPKFEAVVKYILQELEENERETFTKLKKVKENKMVRDALEEAEFVKKA